MTAGPASGHRVRARNTATESENRIHHDEVARRLGFAGGLVPGVTIFAHMCRPALERFGTAWLDGGSLDARFTRPVYDGDEIAIAATDEEGARALRLTVRGPRDEECATGTARLGATASPDPASFATAPLPDPPPPASPEAFAAGRALGTLRGSFDATAAAGYLASIGADDARTRASGLAHPGWLILLANAALVASVRLGPWMHVGSDVRLYRAVRDGEPLETRAKVARAFERKGHRFVELDVCVLAAEAPAMSARHTAIWEPRQLRAGAG